MDVPSINNGVLQTRGAKEPENKMVPYNFHFIKFKNW